MSAMARRRRIARALVPSEQAALGGAALLLWIRGRGVRSSCAGRAAKSHSNCFAGPDVSKHTCGDKERKKKKKREKHARGELHIDQAAAPIRQLERCMCAAVGLAAGLRLPNLAGAAPASSALVWCQSSQLWEIGARG